MRDRARFAFDAVKRHVEDNSVENSEYKSYVKSFPAMILQNGFGNAMAFAFSKSFSDKKKKTWFYVLEDIINWIKNDGKQKELKKEDVEHFLDELLKKDSASYRVWQQEALALLNWTRRFAEGMI